MHIILQERLKGVAAKSSKDRKSSNQESQHQSGCPRPHKTEKV